MNNGNNGESYFSETIDTICEVLTNGGNIHLYPKGKSMLPLLKEQRDSVILKKIGETNDCSLNKYDIVFYHRANGQFVLHRVMKIEANGCYTMCGDNQLTLEKGIAFNQLIGVVTAIYKKNKLLRLTDIRYRIYVRMWGCLPIRHIIFFPRRIVGFIKRRLFS